MPVRNRKIVVDAKVTVIKNADGVLKFRLLGIGFGSKDHRDLDGEFFTKDTDYSDDIFPVKGLNYDHLPIWTDNVYASRVLKTKLIGTAKFVETTEEGRWYEVEVSKAEAYHEYLAKLAEKGYLGASTQAMPGSVTVMATGEITDWAETAMALTVHPANPDTVNNVNEMAKSANIPLYEAIQKSLEDKAEKDALAAAEAEAGNANEDEDADDKDANNKIDTDVVLAKFVENVKTAAAAAAAEAVKEALSAPLAAIDLVVESLVKSVEGISLLTEDKQFKQFVSTFSDDIGAVIKSLRAATFVIAKASKPVEIVLPGKKIKEGGEADDVSDATHTPPKKRTFLPDTYQQK